MDPLQFHELIVCPSLSLVGLYSRAAAVLVTGTGMVESGLEALTQDNGGPARGVFQMEPRTHNSIWDNYLEFRGDLEDRVRRTLAPIPSRVDQLITNPAYATVMCRLVYLPDPEPLPDERDYVAMSHYWGRRYNTIGLQRHKNKFVRNLERVFPRGG